MLIWFVLTQKLFFSVAMIVMPFAIVKVYCKAVLAATLIRLATVPVKVSQDLACMRLNPPKIKGMLVML